MYERPGDLLSKFCSGAQNVILAAPYIKADALLRVLKEVDSKASINCITRWNPHDLAVGASDIDCRTIITERGGSFRLHATLHAKYYKADNVMLIGSANLTSSGMGWSSDPNLEILCRPEDEFDVEAFHAVLFGESREIRDKEFHHWESITQFTDPEVASVCGLQQPIDSWRPSTRDPQHLVLAYKGREDAIASSDEQRAARRDLQALQLPEGLTNEQIKSWTLTCLLSDSFTNSVIRLRRMDAPYAYRELAETFSLGVTEARRDMEAVEIWLRWLAPELMNEDD